MATWRDGVWFLAGVAAGIGGLLVWSLWLDKSEGSVWTYSVREERQG